MRLGLRLGSRGGGDHERREHHQRHRTGQPGAFPQPFPVRDLVRVLGPSRRWYGFVQIPLLGVDFGLGSGFRAVVFGPISCCFWNGVSPSGFLSV